MVKEATKEKEMVNNTHRRMLISPRATEVHHILGMSFPNVYPGLTMVYFQYTGLPIQGEVGIMLPESEVNKIKEFCSQKREGTLIIFLFLDGKASISYIDEEEHNAIEEFIIKMMEAVFGDLDNQDMESIKNFPT